MSAGRSIEELLRQAEHYHEQYMKTLQAALEVRSPSPGAPQGGLGVRMERAGSNDGVPSPMVKAISFDERLPTRAMSGGSDGSFIHGLFRRPRRLTNELGEPKRPSIQPHAGARANRPSSVFTQDMDSDEDVEFLQLTSPNPQPLSHMVPHDEDEGTDEYLSLPHESFTLEQLVKHLQDLGDGNDVMPKALGDMWDHRRELDAQNVVDEGDLDTHPTYEVYDVDHTGLAVPQHEKNDALDGVEAATVWETLKEVSSEGAVGRITILQEPSPLMLGAVHMTMAQHFDMDELFRHLITTDGNKGKTRAYVDRAFESTETRRRTFFFVFKYFTVVGEGLKSAPWQKFDYRPPDKRSIDHIDITECSSILALSLEGQPIKKVTRNNRRQRKKAEEGYIYHPFAPWHLLSIQCFPDNAHSLRSEDLNKKFVSGPYAFLDTLAAEYRDAVKRYATLNEMITKLITPPVSWKPPVFGSYYSSFNLLTRNRASSCSTSNCETSFCSKTQISRTLAATFGRITHWASLTMASNQCVPHTSIPSRTTSGKGVTGRSGRTPIRIPKGSWHTRSSWPLCARTWKRRCWSWIPCIRRTRGLATRYFP